MLGANPVTVKDEVNDLVKFEIALAKISLSRYVPVTS